MKDLTVGKESKQIFFFAVPMLLGNVFQQLYNVVDSIIVGNYLGKDALAAVGASFPIIFTLISLIVGIASGGTIVIAQYYGARDLHRVRQAIGTMFIFIFTAAIILSVIGITFSEHILNLIQLPSHLIPQAKEYLNTYLTGLMAMFGFNITSSVLRGLGDSKTPLYFLIISTIINIILDFVFIVFLDFGVQGAALATILAQSGAFITGVIYLNRNHEIVQFRRESFIFDPEVFKKSIRIGLPTGIQHTFISLGMVALISIVNKFGTAVIAAYTVATRIDSFALLPATNISQALATFVGQNIGAKKLERVRSGMRSTFIISLMISLAVTATVISLNEQIIGLFTKDQAVIDVGKKYLLIVGSFYFLFSMMFTINGVLRGAGATLIPMFISMFSLWIIRVPVAWKLSEKIGETGIWWAVPIAWSVGVIINYIYFKTGKWKTKTVFHK